jgi:hypothetical protein
MLLDERPDRRKHLIDPAELLLVVQPIYDLDLYPGVIESGAVRGYPIQRVLILGANQ